MAVLQVGYQTDNTTSQGLCQTKERQTVYSERVCQGIGVSQVSGRDSAFVTIPPSKVDALRASRYRFKGQNGRSEDTSRGVESRLAV